MAGLLRPPAAARLVTALRERFDLPVHLHTHDTAGGQLATLLAAIDAGVDAVDVASASMAGTTSQPSMSALVAATDGTERATGLDLQAVCDLEPYWEAVRRLYAPFESGLPGPTGRVYHHEIPGGQLSNLRQQAIALGLGERFEAIEDMYAAANRILGRLVKVTPSAPRWSATSPCASSAPTPTRPTSRRTRPKYDIPDSVIGFLSGELGDPPGGWPEPFRTKALQGRTVKPARQRAVGARTGRARSTDPRRTLNRLLFAGPTKDYEASARPTATCPCWAPASSSTGWQRGAEHEVDLEPGKRLLLGVAGGQRRRTSRACAPSCARSTASCARCWSATESVVVDVKAAERADPRPAGPGGRAVRRRRHADRQAGATPSRPATRWPRSRR